MIPLADYTFFDALWTMLVFFLWIAWFFLLIKVIMDVFRRRDIGGGKKTIWLIFMLFVPFIGVFAYLIANSHSMAERDIAHAQRSQAQFDEYVRSVSSSGSGAAAEIDKAKQLLDSGAITQAEFDAIKTKALAT